MSAKVTLAEAVERMDQCMSQFAGISDPDYGIIDDKDREAWAAIKAALKDAETSVRIPLELAENFRRSTDVPRFKRILDAAIDAAMGEPK